MTTLYRYRFGAVVFDEARQELIVGGLAVDVQRRPLQILSLLLSRGGEMVTREEFFETLWEGRPTVDNVLPTAITKLRNALGREGALIENVPRRGYRFTGTLERFSISQPAASRLELAAGQPVALRPEFALEKLLSQANGREVWLAQNPANGERRVYKFAIAAEQVGSLKREVTLSRLLRDELGPRADMANIIGWNFDRSPAFVESEYGGEDLLRWANIDNHLAGATQGERLSVLIQIADAVAAAHGVAVLHKDLKPENVLISMGSEGGWQVRLADFGSGRLLEPERLAQLDLSSFEMTLGEGVGSLDARGTLMYLAPELLRQQPATVRSDLYALGVLSYQLLIGDLRRPLGEGWERDVADELLREDIAKAVDSNPALRPASVQEWADGLRGLDRRRKERLQQRAAELQAQTNREVARRARARRPWLVALMCSLTAGLVVTLFLYNRVIEGQRALSAQYAVSRALNDFLTQHFIAAANPASTGRKDVTVVDAARSSAADIDEVFANADPAVRGGLHAAMQEALAGLSDYESSVGEGQKALSALLAARPQDPARIAEVRIRIADGLTESSKLDAASAQLDSAAQLIRQAHLEDSAVAARYWWSRAGIEIDQLAMPKAVEEYGHAWQLAQQHPELPASTRDSMEYLYADALRMSARYTDAEREAKALIARQQVRLGVDHPLTCHTSLLLASIYGYMRRSDQALELARQAAKCLSERLGPTNIRTVSAYFVLGDLQFQAEHYDDAAVAYDQAAASYTSLLGPSAQRSINQRMNAGVARQYAGHAVEAEKELTATLELADAALGWTHPTVEELRYHVADCRLDQRKTTDVPRLLDGLSSTLLNESNIEPDWDGRLAYQQGRLAFYSGDRAHAIPLLETASRIITARNPDGGRVTPAVVQRFIGDAHKCSGTEGHASGALRRTHGRAECP